MNKKFFLINKIKRGNDQAASHVPSWVQGLKLMTLFLPLSLTVVEKTRCQHEREHILGTAASPRPQPPGLFVPECDEHGQYVPTQCHSGTGYCWCVDRDGREVQGTRTRSGMRPPCKSESRAGDGTSGHPRALLGTLAWGIAGAFCLP